MSSKFKSKMQGFIFCGNALVMHICIIKAFKNILEHMCSDFDPDTIRCPASIRCPATIRAFTVYLL